MKLSSSFRFIDDDLNTRLIGLAKKAGVKHTVDADGILHYAQDDAETVENKLIAAVRKQVFAAWQVVTCPPDWTDRYRTYMAKKRVPFHEELADEEIWFLIPRKYRPHLWNFDAVNSRQKAQMAQ